MKKQFFTAMVLTLFAFASCNKSEDVKDVNLTDENETPVNISFISDQETRAFFDTSSVAEEWEKKVNNITIFTFSSSGNLIVRREFTASEVSAKKASFSLPRSTTGTTVEFYAVANMMISDVMTKSALLAVLENSAGDYNGNFADVSTKSKRTNGFVMSGSLSKTVSDQSTNVAITIKRTVAKIAIQTSLDSGFGSKYKGTVIINSATISNSASQTPVIKPTTVNTGTMNYSHNQVTNSSGDKYNNLFYVFENGTLSEGNRVFVTLKGVYDMDGNLATTADQHEVEYTFELDGKSGGQIERNGYYRIAVNLTGITGNDIESVITVAEWETPVSQSVSLGS